MKKHFPYADASIIRLCNSVDKPGHIGWALVEKDGKRVGIFHATRASARIQKRYFDYVCGHLHRVVKMTWDEAHPPPPVLSPYQRWMKDIDEEYGHTDAILSFSGNERAATASLYYPTSCFWVSKGVSRTQVVGRWSSSS